MLNIYHKSKKPKCLVIFIHGLQGSDATWMNTTTNFLFTTALAADKDLKQKVSFGLFNYYSKIVTPPSSIKQGAKLFNKIFGTPDKIRLNLDVKSIAQLLLTYLEEFTSEYESIVLVCHSMGGLIAKSLVISYADNEIVKKVGLIISLAVPHNGSNLALLGTIMPSVQLDNLQPLSDSIISLNQAWIKNKDTNPLITYVVGKYDTIVPDSSAVGYEVSAQEIKYCDEDHESICKPTSDDALVYRTVKRLILNFISKKKAEEVLEETSNIDDFEDELFVLKMVIADVHNTLISNAKQRFFDAERARKAILILGSQKKELDELYKKIGQVYVNEFGKVLSGNLEGGNALVNAVHEKITTEDMYLLKSIERLNFTHKIGMVHQLANIDKDIWWAKEQSIKTIEEFKKRKTEEL